MLVELHLIQSKAENNAGSLQRTWNKGDVNTVSFAMSICVLCVREKVNDVPWMVHLQHAPFALYISLQTFVFNLNRLEF